MPIDIFSVGVINRVVENVESVPQFLLQTFFPNVQVSETEKIYFDVRDSAPRLSPFVAPFSQGQIVEKLGFHTDSFSPAYIKDKRVFDPNMPLQRGFGEKIGGALTYAQRMDRLIAQQVTDQEQMLSRRLEVMAAFTLMDGGITIVGENYPSTVVDFGRHGDLTVSLSGTAEWGDVGVDPLADLRAWQSLLHVRGKVRPTKVVMTPDSWNLFINSASVVTLLESPREREGTSRTSQLPIITDESPQGEIGGFQITVYQGEYVDPMDNVLKDLLPAYSVLLGDGRLEGVQAFGAIKDFRAGLQARRSFAKSWEEEDPSIRLIMLQSAPLLVPYRVNSLLAATVKQ